MNVKKIKHPKMVPQSTYTAKLRDQEDDLMETATTRGPYDEQPPKRYDELDAKKMGSDPDLSKPKTHKEVFASGGSVQSGSSTMNMARGGRVKDNDINELVDMEDAEEDDAPEGSPIRESYMSPPKERYMSDQNVMLSRGGRIDRIMAKRDKYAEGGEILSEENHDDILSHRSIESDSSSQVDLSRNAEEDANEEDQLSWNALRKENYSETDGLESLTQPRDSNLKGDAREDARSDKHDRVSRIMRRMRK